MVHESGSYTNCSPYTRYSLQRIGKETGSCGYNNASGEDPNDRTDKISQYTEFWRRKETYNTSNSNRRISVNVCVKNPRRSKIIYWLLSVLLFFYILFEFHRYELHYSLYVFFFCIRTEVCIGFANTVKT